MSFGETIVPEPRRAEERTNSSLSAPGCYERAKRRRLVSLTRPPHAPVPPASLPPTPLPLPLRLTAHCERKGGRLSLGLVFNSTGSESRVSGKLGGLWRSQRREQRARGCPKSKRERERGSERAVRCAQGVFNCGQKRAPRCVRCVGFALGKGEGGRDRWEPESIFPSFSASYQCPTKMPREARPRQARLDYPCTPPPRPAPTVACEIKQK